MIGAHVSHLKARTHLGAIAADAKRGIAFFWAKRGGVPQEFHGSFGK